MSGPYYFVHEGRGGRWNVCHRIPGTELAHADCECPSYGAAVKEAAELERRRRQQLLQVYAEQLLRNRGVRA